MKKLISAITAAALTFTGFAAAVPSAQAADSSIDKIVFLGDSITSGYGLEVFEYNYAQIVANYTGAEMSNYAVPGSESGDLYNQLTTNEEVASDLKNADLVVISIGANDMKNFAADRLFAIAKSAKCLKDEYTDQELPQNPTFGDIRDMLDKDKLKAFASSTSNMITISTELSKLTNDLGMTSDNPNASRYKRVIETQTIPNIAESIKHIKELNPDAEIMVETMYNPLDFEESYYKSAFNSTYQTLLNNLMVKCDSILASFSAQLNACAEANGAEVIDVQSVFASVEEGKDVRYTWYFEKMQDEKMDIHPNQAGNVAIAAEILDKLSGEGKITLHDDNGHLYNAYKNIKNKDSYPAVAYATLAKVLGDLSKAAAPEPKPEYKTGDFNDDGMIDSTDASAILEAYALLSTNQLTLTEKQNLAGDVNDDKLVDSNDASIILSYYAAISTGYDKSIVEFVKGN